MGLVTAFALACLAMVLCLSCVSNSTTGVQAGGETPSRSRPAAPPDTLRRQTMIENPGSLRVGERFSFPSASQIDDTAFSASELAKSHRAIVFAMTSTTCPLSNMYGPRLASLEIEYASKRVAFVHVNVVDAESREEMRQFIREYRLRGAYLPDKDHVIAATLSPRTTTEVFVFDPTFTLIYRGAIDDQYGIGTAQDAPRKLFLRDALDSFLAGEPPKVAATWAPGCLVDSREAGAAAAAAPAASAANATPTITYTNRISKIIDTHCVECHRPFGVAPFSLATHQNIAGRARMIEAVVRDGLMPPSHGGGTPSSPRSPWVNAREIPDDEKADLIAWLNSSRPVGELKESPLPLERPRGWSMGSPDALLTAGPIELPVDGPMLYTRAIVPTNFTVDQWVSIIECRPMKQNAIHHALVWLLPPGGVLPDVNDNPTSLELVFAYSPGQSVIRYDAGAARRIPAGSMFIVDLYARPMGRVMTESLRIGLKTAATPPSREVRTLMLAASDLRIAPGDSHAVNRATMELREETTVLSLAGYMRGRGVAFSLAAKPPRGAEELLLDAPRYAHRWQIRHEYAEPRTLPARTTLTLSGVHDNSEENRNNPDPRATVKAGPRVGDEALFVAIETLKDIAPRPAHAGTSR